MPASLDSTVQGREAGQAEGRLTSQAVGPKVRLTGVLVEDGRILLAKQTLREQSHWNLPGGSLEAGETLEQALVREMKEETGLDVQVDRLLYITDRFKGLGHQVVDICFAVSRVGGMLASSSASDNGQESIERIEMVPMEQLADYGFSDRFVWLVENDFPRKGTYQGDFHRFYG